MHVQNVHQLVGFYSAFQEKNKKGTQPANLQVIWKQASNGFVDEGLSDDITGKVGPQGVSTKLHAELFTIFTQLII